MTDSELSDPLCVELETKLSFEESPDLGDHYEPLTSEPITVPFKNLDQVLLWKPGEDDFNVAMHSLAQKAEIKDDPLTLVCHDMMGGYIDDRFVQGVPKMDCYFFYHWHYLDYFIYFSHHFVTIPPPCWTNAAHKNGVPMLGTIITEWKDGAARCQEVFQSEAAFTVFANKLVEMTTYYNFDGWLVNIENPIKPHHMPQLVDFVKYLTQRMHEAKPGSKVIWYDSVIQDGSLKWQDMLNYQNSMFFDGSDGMFLNYTWNEQKLASSVQNAAGRRQDVFVGLDVFGRNCFGGGGWNSDKAMEVIREKKLSAAIFAPGWVFECLPKENFHDNQNKFWEEKLHRFFHPRAICSLPFISNFCQGYGKKGFRFGKEIMCKEWCNLSAQLIQPSFNNQQFKETPSSTQSMKHFLEDGCNGGGCMQLGGDVTQGEVQFFKLFHTAIGIHHPMLISFSTKQDGQADGCLVLELSSGSKIVLWSNIDKETAENQVVTPYGVRQSAPLQVTCLPDALQGENVQVFGPLVGTSHKSLEDVTLGMDSDSVNYNGWINRYYVLPEAVFPADEKITLIGVACYTTNTAKSSYSFLVGEIRICDPSTLAAASEQVSDLSCTNISWHQGPKALENSKGLTTFCGTLSWKYQSTALYFDVFCSGIEKHPNKPLSISKNEKVFVGRAYCHQFRVCHLVVTDVKIPITWYVQPTSEAGMAAPFSNMSRIKVIPKQ